MEHLRGRGSVKKWTGGLEEMIRDNKKNSTIKTARSRIDGTQIYMVSNIPLEKSGTCDFLFFLSRSVKHFFFGCLHVFVCVYLVLDCVDFHSFQIFMAPIIGLICLQHHWNWSFLAVISNCALHTHTKYTVYG